MKRRQFVKVGATGLAALVVGAKMPWIMSNPAYAAVPVNVVNFTITDAVKHMVTDQTLIATFPPDPLNPTVSNPVGNRAQCYFWIYKEDSLDADCPGPIIFTTTGARIKFVITNELDTPHCLAIPALRFTTGPIKPGATVTKTFVARTAGTYLYYDNLNAPVNRMMGLHGALVIMPRAHVRGHNFTPYDRPTANIQKLFDDLGNKFGKSPWWPGLAWEEGDPASDTPAFRQNIWLLHEASSRLFAAVGNNTPISFTVASGPNAGRQYVDANPRDPVVFTDAFLHDTFSQIQDPAFDPLNPGGGGIPSNFVAQYFTISGQSGHFSHNNPWICPYSRVGEPYLIRILNAGLWLHSTHIHANHVFVLQHNNKTDVFPGSLDNPIWIDVYTANPLDTYDWLIPYMRPPDVPSDLGIGRDDLEQSLDVSATAVTLGNFGIANPEGPAPFLKADVPPNPVIPGLPEKHTTWPPLQELETFIPNVEQVKGKLLDGVTDVDCAVRLSPVCFPMHDHSEPTQATQGGNYNCGLISGVLFTGDRKGARPGGPGVLTFPDRPTGPNFVDPNDPIRHGPDIEPGQEGVLPPTQQFIMPTLP